MNGCVQVKDHLLQLLNEENPAKCIANCELVTTILENTEGFWVDLSYCYKAVEIATRTIHALNGHHAPQRKRKFEALIGRLWTLQSKYHVLQHRSEQLETA